MNNILQSFHHILLNPTKKHVDLYNFDFGECLLIFEDNIAGLLPITLIKTTKISFWA